MNVLSSYQASSNAELPNTVITKKDRRYQLAKLFIIALVSIATVTLTIIDVIQTAKSFGKKEELTYKIQGSIDTAMVIHNLQIERGMTTLQLAFQRLHYAKERLKLRNIRRKTNESIVVLEKRDDTELRMLTGGTTSFWHTLEDFRRKIDFGRSNVIERLQTYRKWIIGLISTLAKYTESEDLGDYANVVYAYEMVILSKEEAGMERALGGLKFTQGKNFSAINTTWYNEKRVLAQNYLETAFLFSSELKNIHTSLFANTSHLFKKIDKKRKVLSRSAYQTFSDDEAYAWFELMTKYINIMLELQVRIAVVIETKLKEEIDQSTNQLVIRSLLLCFTLIVVPCIIISLARVQKSFYEYTLSLFDKVGLEQARTDFLMRENSRYVDSKYM
ncbi:Hypothetical predicted protein [Paramuricea clavata]|uniref:Uncharacterized protein n=1 Tax=Paramuricea clavata TaxID=317549 RepID=A0A6S7II53_PARCT|nr:Hypothetical predicted protein [Paramuricea clavata]